MPKIRQLDTELSIIIRVSTYCIPQTDYLVKRSRPKHVAKFKSKQLEIRLFSSKNKQRSKIIPHAQNGRCIPTRDILVKIREVEHCRHCCYGWHIPIRELLIIPTCNKHSRLQIVSRFLRKNPQKVSKWKSKAILYLSLVVFSSPYQSPTKYPSCLEAGQSQMRQKTCS